MVFRGSDTCTSQTLSKHFVSDKQSDENYGRFVPPFIAYMEPKKNSTAKKLFNPQELSHLKLDITLLVLQVSLRVSWYAGAIKSNYDRIIVLLKITYLKKKHFRPMSALAKTYNGLRTFCSLSICVGARDLCMLYLTLYYTGECNTEADL